jgi:D-aminoacyl-tRNA deacylase
MLTVIQRVSHASVSVKNTIVGKINHGILALVAISPDDSNIDIDFTIKKLTELRIFSDENGKFNYSVQDVNGSILMVSQFTLLGETKKGRRPSFTKAAPPQKAKSCFNSLVEKLQTTGITVETGQFGAHMEVNLLNDGPVTLIIDSTQKTKAS